MLGVDYERPAGRPAGVAVRESRGLEVVARPASRTPLLTARRAWPVGLAEPRLAAVVREYRVHDAARGGVVGMPQKMTEFMGHRHTQHVPILSPAAGRWPAVVPQGDGAVRVAGGGGGEVVRSQ